MNTIKAVSGVILLLFIFLALSPAISAESGSPVYRHADILHPAPDTLPDYVYEELTLDNTAITDGQTGGAIELKEIPEYQLLHEAPPGLDFSKIYIHPLGAYALITSTQVSLSQTLTPEYDGAGPLFQYWFGNSTLKRITAVTYIGAVRTMAFHPNGLYALVAYGDFDSNYGFGSQYGISKLNLVTWTSTKVSIPERGGVQGRMQEANTIVFTDNGDHAYIGQYNRYMAVYSDSSNTITVIDDDTYFLTREYIVDGVVAEYNKVKNKYDGWRTSTEVLNPPNTPATALYGYYHGISAIEKSNALGYAIDVLLVAEGIIFIIGAGILFVTLSFSLTFTII